MSHEAEIDPDAFNLGRALSRELLGSQIAGTLGDNDAVEVLTRDIETLRPGTEFSFLLGAVTQGITLAVGFLEEWAANEVRLTIDPDLPTAVEERTEEQRDRVVAATRRLWGPFLEASIAVDSQVGRILDESDQDDEAK